MIKREAIVVAAEDGTFTVEAARDKMCGCCSNMFCGVKKEGRLKLKSPLDLKAGDRVELGLRSSIVVGFSLLIFFLPCLILIGGIYAFKGLGPAGSFFLSILDVGLYFILLKFAVINRLKEKLSCRIIRVLS
jgi:positive regulator of sigma E activity